MSVDSIYLEEEAELAARAAHDDAAFAALYDFYFPKIHAFIARRVGHRETTEDLVQQTFLKACTALRSYAPRPGVTFGAWLYRIATNTLIDHYRTAPKRQHAELDENIDAAADVDQARDADRLLEKKKLEALLRKLPERDQQVLTLKYFSELTNQEIAGALGCNANHVGVLLFRALKKAQKLYPQI
jgi:RNA polymerase sigma-70 factor (ECF subfamily)